MDLLGVGLIGLAGLLIITTGLPAFMILCGLAVCGALCGMIWGDLGLAVIAALPTRLISLFENDLLQALPLYVCVGVLLDRLPVTTALYRTIRTVFGQGAGADAATTLVIGSLLGPMNGSVGANVIGLSRSIYPRLLQHGVKVSTAQGLICIASTLGVVIPPSLVLILLGDAMLNAHTIALQGTPRTDRIINTQDIFQGVIVPACVLLAAFLLMAFYKGQRNHGAKTVVVKTSLGRSDAFTACLSLTVLLGLLGGVVSGIFYAVEAAATGAALLLIYGFVGGHLTLRIGVICLQEAAAATGALFALLIAATSFTLMLRLLGTDRLIADWLLAMHTSSFLFLCLILLIMTATALVLDVFEIIFVVIPILAPPLLMRVDDAVWVSVCLLLTLQFAFLLPPIGYALMMTRSITKPHVPLAHLMRSISPYLVLQSLVLMLVLFWPNSVHVFDKPNANQRSLQAPVSPAAIKTQLQQLLPSADMQPMPALPQR